MGNSCLAVNSVIEWFKTETQTGRLARLLWIDEKGSVAVIYRLSGKPASTITVDLESIVSAIESGEAIIRPFDPYLPPMLDDAEIDEKQIWIREKNWNVIKGLVCDEPAIYLPEKRGRRIRETAKATGVQRKYVYKYLNRYWQRGMTKNALLPDYQNCGGLKTQKACSEYKRGRPPNNSRINQGRIGVNITEVDKALIRKAIDKYYDSKEKRPIARVYRLLLENHYNKGFQKQEGVNIPVMAPPEECLSYDQFYYWFRKFQDLKKSLNTRIGEKSFNLKYRPVLNKSTHFAHGPGHIFQIDSTIADIYLLSSFFSKQIIGRPVLYFVVDVFSRMVAGFYVGLEGPSWIGGSMALAITAMDKVEYCAHFGINIQQETWPVEALPHEIVVDRGREWLGHNSDKLINNLGITVTNTPPYRADFKGIVEQEFRRANVSAIKWIPGAVKNRFREPGDKDHRLDATLTIPEFAEVLIRMIINYNNNYYIDEYPLFPEMIADGVKPVPVELWNWGMKNRTGYLRHRTKQEVILGLMPTGNATVSWKGIKFKGLHYDCEKAISDGWYEYARSRGSWKCKVYYDPRRIGNIYLLPKHEKDPVECRLLEKDLRFSGYFLEDLQEQQAVEKFNKAEHQFQARQGTAEQEALISKVIKCAENRKKLAEECFEIEKRHAMAIGENKKIERSLLADKDAFNPTKGSPHQIGWNGETEDDKCSESILSDPSHSKKQYRLELLIKTGKGGSPRND